MEHSKLRISPLLKQGNRKWKGKKRFHDTYFGQDRTPRSERRDSGGFLSTRTPIFSSTTVSLAMARIGLTRGGGGGRRRRRREAEEEAVEVVAAGFLRGAPIDRVRDMVLPTLVLLLLLSVVLCVCRREKGLVWFGFWFIRFGSVRFQGKATQPGPLLSMSMFRVCCHYHLGHTLLELHIRYICLTNIKTLPS